VAVCRAFQTLNTWAHWTFVNQCNRTICIDRSAYIFIQTIQVFTIAFYALHANFRHSHIWISYGPTAEHVFMSPAQHQLHHSILPKHHHANFGSMLSVWDWLFGTLCLAGDERPLDFGLATADGRRIAPLHPTWKDAMLVPFMRVGQTLAGEDLYPAPAAKTEDA